VSEFEQQEQSIRLTLSWLEFVVSAVTLVRHRVGRLFRRGI